MQQESINYDSLIADIMALKNLDRALRLLEQGNFVLSEMDVVAQDEFSHDVIIPFAEGPRTLVLSVT